MKKPFHGEVEFELGDIVYLRLSDDPMPGIVSGIGFYIDSTRPMYIVSWGDRTTDRHYEAELTTEHVPHFPGEPRMKVFKGAKRVAAVVAKPPLSPRFKLIELMGLLDHPEEFRTRVRAILEINRKTLFGKTKTEFYDLGNPVIVMIKNTKDEYRGEYRFDKVEAKRDCRITEARVYIDDRLVGTRDMGQTVLGGQDFVDFTYYVNGDFR